MPKNHPGFYSNLHKQYKIAPVPFNAQEKSKQNIFTSALHSLPFLYAI